MSKRDIFEQNSNKLKTTTTSEKAVFNFLLRNKGKSFTQQQIAERLKIHRSTVSRALEKLNNRVFTQGKSYIVIQCEGRYGMVHPEDIDREITPKERDEYDRRVTKKANEIDNPKIWTASYATCVTNTVVLYEINSRYRNLVIKTLNELYSAGIHDIVQCKNGLYIILKETSASKYRSLLCELYLEMAKK